jgi:hypothetical protein
MPRDPDALVRELDKWPSDESARRVVRFLRPHYGMISWGMTRDILAADCDALAPILVRHASPEVRAAILRELLIDLGADVPTKTQAATNAVTRIGHSPPTPEAPDAD